MATPFPDLSATLLKKVFERCCEDKPVHLPLQPSDPRQILSRVCRRWADVVQSTASLWDNIHFTKPPHNTAHGSKPLLDDFSDCIQYSRQNPLQITFDMVCDGWEFSIVHSIILPHIRRIRTLSCPIYGNHHIVDFLSIEEGRFSILESIEICFINTWATPYSFFPLEDRLNFTGLHAVPRLRKVIARLLNGLSPIDLRLPWGQLATLDLGTTAIPPHVLVRILSSTVCLDDGFFYVECARLPDPHLALSRHSVTMHSLRTLRLRLLYPSEDSRLFSVLLFPSLQYLLIEMHDQFQDWDISLYTKLLQASTKTLRQLRLFDFAPTKFGVVSLQGIDDVVRRRHHETSYQVLENFFEVISNVEVLRLPLGVYVHAPTVEKMASCALLPSLHSIELGTIHGQHILCMARQRHAHVMDASLKPGTSKSRLASLKRIQMYVPRCSGEEKAGLVHEAQALGTLGIVCYVQSTQILPLRKINPLIFWRQFLFNFP